MSNPFFASVLSSHETPCQRSNEKMLFNENNMKKRAKIKKADYQNKLKHLVSILSLWIVRV